MTTTPNMGIRIASTGGPNVLEFAELDQPTPGPHQAVVEITAAGVNFIDTYHRTGLYPMDLPMTPGLEGAGTIGAVGADVTEFAVGDRVAWTGSIASYATRKAVDVDSLVAIPDNVADDIAAAAMLQGLTAHYLATDTYHVEPGSMVLIHAGAGGVGLLLTQIAKILGAEVFTTVGTQEKAERSRAAGADHVIMYRDVDFAEEIGTIAGERMIDVVYDGVGNTTFRKGLAVLRRRGLMVAFGNASGPVDPISPLELSKNGSLFLTRPTLFDHVTTPEELRTRTADLFGWIGAGQLRVHIGSTYPLAEASDAHTALEARQTTGKVLLRP